MHYKANGWFGLICIGNVGNQVLLNSLVVSALKNLDKNSQRVKKSYDRVWSDMIAKAIVGYITEISL